MSVDHYDCDCCDKTGVYEEFIAYTSCCGVKICSDCLIDIKLSDNYIYPACNEDNEVKKEYCPFCSGLKINDKMRIDFLLKLAKLTIKELDEQIKENK